MKPVFKKLTLSLALCGFLSLAHASEVVDLGPSLDNVPADMQTQTKARPSTQTEAAKNGGTVVADAPAVDLGSAESTTVQDVAPAAPAAAVGKRTTVDEAKAAGEKVVRKPPRSAASQAHGTERVVFDRAPVRVPLPVGVERLITFPAPVALHVPDDMQKVARIENIDRTLYVTAKVPFTTLRVIAELIDSGKQVPLDLMADKGTITSKAELEVFVTEVSESGAASPGPAAAAASEAMTESQQAENAPADIVQLTRYAARQLYAPKRLTGRQQGIQQVDVASEKITNLFRGVNVTSVPVGQWRSGNLYVTAVLVKNGSNRPVEIPLEQIRGKWLAATAQHGRIGAAGTEIDTTAVYLVCDRRFEACK
ncbi:TIGR03749 family integrating conjugative element protein [Comamonas jiangduensis]|uniref:TIGR03749 family integrating conjugative element protein n=1 Tax=Comamonas jiangduensis TaxID=1194168 RepID=UPI003BF7D9A2